MIVATLLWSMAGVVTRHLDSTGGVEATFWRSLFNAVALVVLLGRLRGFAALGRTLASRDPTLWLSAACWAVMFTAFMPSNQPEDIQKCLTTRRPGPSTA